MSIKYIKAKIDIVQQNRKCKLCGDKNETVNPIISEFNKLMQKEYESRHDWVGKVIHKELCKSFNLMILPNGICVNQNSSYKMMVWFLYIMSYQSL